jgi:hypothetical protein
MARRLLLDHVMIEGLPQGPVTLDYGETMEAILRAAPPGQGLSLDEVIRCSSALERILEAKRQHAADITMTDEQWKVLVEKLQQFRFPFADAAIVCFGRMIREAPEVGVEQLVARAAH